MLKEIFDELEKRIAKEIGKIILEKGKGMIKDIKPTTATFIETVKIASRIDELTKGFDAYRSGDYGAANRLLEKPALDGQQAAQFILGYINFEGSESLPKNHAHSLKWFKMSAHNGHPDAQCYLGMMYREGWGTEQNLDESLKWFKLAAEQGSNWGLLSVAFLYFQGTESNATNVAEARKYLKQAAAQDHPHAAYLLGHSLIYSEECSESQFKEGMRFLQQSATLGYERARREHVLLEITGKPMSTKEFESTLEHSHSSSGD